MSQTVQGIVLRIPNGAPLTDQQGDSNLQILANFCNSLSASISVSLTPSGTLVPGALNNLNQIATSIPDGIITQLTLPVGVFNGGTNTYAVTNANVATLQAGSRIQFDPDTNCNAGSVFVKLNGGTSILVVPQGGGSTLNANMITANHIVEVIYDGSSFHLVQMASVAGVAIPGEVVLATANDVKAGTDSAKAITCQALANAIFSSTGTAGTGILNVNGNSATIAHGLPAVPSKVRFVLVCTTNDHSYLVGREVNAGDFTGSSQVQGFVTSADATNVILDYTTASTQYPQICPAGGGNRVAITPGSWAIKVYASVF